MSTILLLGSDVSINVCHKSAARSDMMLSKHVDILALKETWLSASDTSACLADIYPYGFVYVISTTVIPVGVVELHFFYMKHIK